MYSSRTKLFKRRILVQNLKVILYDESHETIEKIVLRIPAGFTKSELEEEIKKIVSFDFKVVSIDSIGEETVTIKCSVNELYYLFYTPQIEEE